MAQGKRYAESAKLVDKSKLYSAKEALEHNLYRRLPDKCHLIRNECQIGRASCRERV